MSKTGLDEFFIKKLVIAKKADSYHRQPLSGNACKPSLSYRPTRDAHL